MTSPDLLWSGTVSSDCSHLSHELTLASMCGGEGNIWDWKPKEGKYERQAIVMVDHHKQIHYLLFSHVWYYSPPFSPALMWRMCCAIVVVTCLYDIY